jgi:trehalose 6-phosphate phosphatase
VTVSDQLTILARVGPMAIYTDIDGTLSPIAPTPASARVADGAGDALRAIVRSGIRVVAISGRSAFDARGMIGLDEIDYAGNHGFELLTADGPVVSEEVARASEALQSAMFDLTAALPDLPAGVIVENKTYTGSVHYRLTDEPDAALAELRPLVMEVANRLGLVVTEGRMVIELRPPLHINKGVFVRSDVITHGIRSAAYLGDDLTDVDGFMALHALKSSGELDAALAVAVTSTETLPPVIRESDVQIEGVLRLVSELQRFAAVREQS